MTAPKPQRSPSDDTDRLRETPETIALTAALHRLASVILLHVPATPTPVIDAMSDVIEALRPIATERSDLLDALTAERTAREEAEAERLKAHRLATNALQEAQGWREAARTTEVNLIALACMYGEACGQLWIKHFLLQGVVDEAESAEHWKATAEAEAEIGNERAADRDRLAEEVERLRTALEFYAQDGVWLMQGECNPAHPYFTGPNTAARALTSTKGADDDA